MVAILFIWAFQRLTESRKQNYVKKNLFFFHEDKVNF